MKRTIAGLAVILFCAALAIPAAAAPNLVTNGGFETGSFSGWSTVFPSGGYYWSFVGPVSGNGNDPHSGSYAAFIGEGNPSGSLSETLATTPGQEYEISYWLKVGNTWETWAGGDGVNHTTDINNWFKPYFDGVLLDNSIAQVQSQPEYVKYTYNATATGTSTVLQLSSSNYWGHTQLDDVSVAAVPEGSSLALLLPGLLPLTLVARRRMRKA